MVENIETMKSRLVIEIINFNNNFNNNYFLFKLLKINNKQRVFLPLT